jgi:sulfate transport system substrate-binding protein
MRTLIVYGFSILGESMIGSTFPGFSERWRQAKGEEVQFISSFAGSGTVTNQILLGVPAQLAVLSLELDAQKLADRGLVPPGCWTSLPHHGVLNLTPFVILVRPGNPHGIKDFVDLARPGVKIVHPDPLTSGGAQWAILAEYGSVLRRTRNPEEAERVLTGLWKNVVAQASSARGARTQYESGFGDALVTYEQELLSDKARGRLKGEIVYPPSTILSEHTVVPIERNVLPADRALHHAFREYLWSEEAQRQFVERGFRSPVEAYNGKTAPIGDAFRVADLGGWPKARADIVEGIWKARVLPQLGQ